MQARAIFRVSRSVEAVAVEAEEPVEAAEARAERLTRKFAHEAKAAADEHDALIRKYAISVQRLWLEQAYQSQEGETPRTKNTATLRFTRLPFANAANEVHEVHAGVQAGPNLNNIVY